MKKTIFSFVVGFLAAAYFVIIKSGNDPLSGGTWLSVIVGGLVWGGILRLFVGYASSRIGSDIGDDEAYHHNSYFGKDGQEYNSLSDLDHANRTWDRDRDL